MKEKHSRILFALLLIAVAAICAIAFFGQYRQDLAEQNEQESEPTEYTLYVLVPVTGQLSYIGEPVAWTVQYAQDSINASGGILGKQVKLVTLDTEFNTQTVSALEEEYLLHERVFIGPVDVPGTSAGIDFVIGQGMANIAAYSYEDIRELAAPYGVSYMSDSSEGEFEAVSIWKQLNPDISRVVIFVNPSEQSQVTTAARFAERLPDMGIEVLDIIDVPTGEESQLGSIVQALNQKADGYISLVRAEDYVNIVTQLRLRGVTEGRRITATFAAYDSQLFEAGEALDGTYIWNKFDINYEGADWQQLVESYAAEHDGAVPESNTVPDIYNAIMAWRQCIEELGLGLSSANLEQERSQIAAWLYDSPVIQGIQGDFQWVNGKKVSSVYYFQFEGSNAVYVHP